MNTCTGYVTDDTGLNIRFCGRPAKRYFIDIRGTKTYRCGLHSRSHAKDRTLWFECGKEQKP